MTEPRPRIAIVTFPGSNDDGDACLALEHLGADAVSVWHTASEVDPGIAGAVLPGGFSYGDYLRCGALARIAPVMDVVRELAADGAPVLGICNGFQILCEAGLLPGVLRANRQLEFVCADVAVTVESTDTPSEPLIRTTPPSLPRAIAARSPRGCSPAGESGSPAGARASAAPWRTSWHRWAPTW